MKYGKTNWILEYERKVGKDRDIKERLNDYDEFHTRLTLEEQQIQVQDVWIVESFLSIRSYYFRNGYRLSVAQPDS